MPGNGELGRRDPRAEPVRPVELEAPERGSVDAGPGQRRTEGAGSTTIVRPGALTQLLADLARAPEGAGWDVPLEPGQSVGRFEIQREIGRGGFGVVYEARDTELGRSVAFKAIRASGADATREARLLGEAEAAARLAHPNVVHLYDVGRSEQGAFLIMELLHGQTLSEKLLKGPLPLREAVRVAVEISRGLAHAHDQGVLHRDLKPSNVFLCEDGQVKVLDFGLAHVFGRAGIAGGTAPYMAPEQAQGETGDERSDVFSLGVVIREMLTGRLPVPYPSPPPDATEASPLSPAAAGERGPTPAGSSGVRGRGELVLLSVPAALQKLLARMLAGDKVERPATGAEAYEELAAIQKALEPRRLLWATLATAAAAVVGAATFAYFWQRPLPPGRLLVAMADTVNQTGDPDFDGVSELLRPGLEQSPRIALMARSRLVNDLQAAGSHMTPVIDESRARQAARRAQAHVLIVPEVRRQASEYNLYVRAIDLSRSEPLFTIPQLLAAKGSLREIVDSLALKVRKQLGDEAGASPQRTVSTTEIASADPEAWARYVEGKRLESEGRLEKAVEAYRRALALDPESPLLRFALLEAGSSDPFVLLPDDLAVMRRTVGRLPPKDRSYAEFLLTVEDSTHGGGMEFADLLEQLERHIRSWPEDPRPYVDVAFTHLIHLGDVAAAEPYLEKASLLAPTRDPRVIELLLAAGRLNEANSRARRWTEEAPGSPAFRALATVSNARGAISEAMDAARRDLAVSRDAPRGVALLVFAEADAIDELEPAIRKAARPPIGWLLLRGRTREALTSFYGAAPQPSSARDARWERASRHFFVGAPIRFARGDSAGLWREAESQFRNGGPWPVFCNAYPLAALGDLDRAGRLVTDWTSRQHVCVRAYRLVRQWKTGDREGALRGFTNLAMGSAHLYRGEILMELGRDRDAVEELRLARREALRNFFEVRLSIPNYTRSLYLEAAALERLGERDEARKVLGRLLHLWERADADLPLLAEAKALRKRLADAAGKE